jgi:hypothetical protein
MTSGEVDVSHAAMSTVVGHVGGSDASGQMDASPRLGCDRWNNVLVRGIAPPIALQHSRTAPRIGRVASQEKQCVSAPAQVRQCHAAILDGCWNA